MAATKTCRKCEQTKPVADFYKHSQKPLLAAAIKYLEVPRGE